MIPLPPFLARLLKGRTPLLSRAMDIVDETERAVGEIRGREGSPAVRAAHALAHAGMAVDPCVEKVWLGMPVTFLGIYMGLSGILCFALFAAFGFPGLLVLLPALLWLAMHAREWRECGRRVDQFLRPAMCSLGRLPHFLAEMPPRGDETEPFRAVMASCEERERHARFRVFVARLSRGDPERRFALTALSALFGAQAASEGGSPPPDLGVDERQALSRAGALLAPGA